MAHGLGQHRYEISFVPRELRPHTITVKFNRESVPGSPFTCKIEQSAAVEISGVGLERVPVNRCDVSLFFRINTRYIFVQYHSICDLGWRCEFTYANSGDRRRFWQFGRGDSVGDEARQLHSRIHAKKRR